MQAAIVGPYLETPLCFHTLALTDSTISTSLCFRLHRPLEPNSTRLECGSSVPRVCLECAVGVSRHTRDTDPNIPGCVNGRCKLDQDLCRYHTLSFST